MAKKTRLGIILLIVAVLFAVFNIVKIVNHTEDETTTETAKSIRETSRSVEESTEVQTQNITEIITEAETVTMNIYSDEHSEMKAFDVRFPEEEILSLVNNDKEGLNTEVQAFVNGYGYQDAMYADYAGDVQINSYDETITLTYYLKYKRKEAIYFYLIYSKKTKQWSLRLA